MNITEIAVMLTFAASLDGRIQPDEGTVMAWSNVLDNRIDTFWASEYVKKHYGRTGDMLIPSALNKAWSDHSRLKVLNQPDLDSHCGKTGCKCTHRLCYKGWIDPDPNIDTKYLTVEKCVVCRPAVTVSS
jgi:hypothetical protein